MEAELSLTRRRLLSCAGSIAVLGHSRRQIYCIDMKFAWKFSGDRLEFLLKSPARGWALVGFNHQPQLRGARLLMMAAGNQKAVIEEHLADPPRHYQRNYPRPEEQPLLQENKVDKEGTSFRGSILAAPQQAGIATLKPGLRYHLIFAYSHHLDFNHHSARRSSLNYLL